MTRTANSTGSALSDYPRPSVAVDVAVLTVRDDALDVVVVKHRLGGWALPGTFVHQGERLAEAAARGLGEQAGLRNVEFAQLRVFDAPGRDDRGWVLSVGHSGAVATDRIPGGVRLMPVEDTRVGGTLLFDHADIVRLAVDTLRHQYGQAIDPAGLLGRTFTVLQLRRLYQAVFGRPMIKDTFRRYVIDYLEPTGEMAAAFGRPAELFSKREGAALPSSAWAFFVAGR